MMHKPSIVTVVALSVVALAMIFGCGGGSLNVHLPQKIADTIANLGDE